MKITATPQTAHKPYPIADMDIGEYTAKEPWLSPRKGFLDITDGYSFRSRIHRREGFGRFAQMGIPATPNFTASLGDNLKNYRLNVITERIVGESIVVTWDDPVSGPITASCGPNSWKKQFFFGSDRWGWEITEPGAGTVLGFATQAYEGNGVLATVDWTSHSQYTGTDPAGGSIEYALDHGLPVTGIKSYRDNDGSEYLVSTNTRRFFYYNSSSGWFEPATVSDVFTGADTDQFWFWPTGSYLIATNGVDTIQRFIGSTNTLEPMPTTIGGGPNSIQTAKIAFIYRNRLVYMHVTENGTLHRGRMRWTGAGAYESLDAADFADAPPDMGALVTVGFVADRILVGFENGWLEAVYTGDRRGLFAWERTTFDHGARARSATIADGDRVIARTSRGMDAVDPNEQYPVDVAIPDHVLTKLDNGLADFCSGARALGQRQFWWSVASVSAIDGRPNEMLVAQYQEDKSLRWATWDVPFNCYGEFTSLGAPTYDDIDLTFDEINSTYDDASGVSDFPIMLCGHNNGTVFQYGGEQDKLDDLPFVGQESVPFEITTERISPTPGKKSHWGWVDIYLEASPNTSIQVSFYGDTEQGVYKTNAFSLNVEGTGEKIYRRIAVNKTATFHRMTIRASGGGRFAIDAIIPWFRDSGRMREFG